MQKLAINLCRTIAGSGIKKYGSNWNENYHNDGIAGHHAENWLIVNNEHLLSLQKPILLGLSCNNWDYHGILLN